MIPGVGNGVGNSDIEIYVRQQLLNECDDMDWESTVEETDQLSPLPQQPIKAFNPDKRYKEDHLPLMGIRA